MKKKVCGITDTVYKYKNAEIPLQYTIGSDGRVWLKVDIAGRVDCAHKVLGWCFHR